MQAMPRAARRPALLLLAAVLGSLAPTPSRAASALARVAASEDSEGWTNVGRAAQRGRIIPDASRGGALSEEGVPWFDRPLDDKLDAQDYPPRLIEITEPYTEHYRLKVPQELSLEAVEDQFNAMRFKEVRDHYLRPEPDERRPPDRSFGFALQGVTGLMTLPNSFVLPAGEWAVGLSYQNEEHGSRHWPDLYRDFQSDALRGYVGRGFKGNFELGLIFHNVDSDITYQAQAPNTLAPRYSDRRTLAGISYKGAIPAHGVWMAAGFTAEYLEDGDRNFMDLRTFDYMANAFFTVSDGGPRWDGTLMLKWTRYAGEGKRPPVGASANQPGFSPQSDWTQIGLGFEYGKWDGLSVLAEVTDRHRIEYFDLNEKEFNLGLQYETGDFQIKGYALRLNHRDEDNYAISASMRFR